MSTLSDRIASLEGTVSVLIDVVAELRQELDLNARTAEYNECQLWDAIEADQR